MSRLKSTVRPAAGGGGAALAAKTQAAKTPRPISKLRKEKRRQVMLRSPAGRLAGAGRWRSEPRSQGRDTKSIGPCAACTPAAISEKRITFCAIVRRRQKTYRRVGQHGAELILAPRPASSWPLAKHKFLQLCLH